MFLFAIILLGREENIKNEKERTERRERERKIQNTKVESNGKPVEKECDFATGVAKCIAISLVLVWFIYFAYKTESSDPWGMLILMFGFGITFAIAFLIIIVRAFSPQKSDELGKNDIEYYDRLVETKERNKTGKNK